jgi:hypothetical protein
MPRIFTPPDYEFDRSIKKILIRNCEWTEEQISSYITELSDKIYDIYIYNDKMNDVQWYEGIRTSSIKVIDYKNFKNLDPVEWLRTLDDIVQ